MIRSFAKVIPNPTMADLGMHKQLELMRRLENLGTLACVVDSNSVLKNPKQQLQKICSACNIPFNEAMLSWKAGARNEDGRLNASIYFLEMIILIVKVL